MPIPTEPSGSIPRPAALIDALQGFRAGRIGQQELDAVYLEALGDTIRRFEETGSPVITDGEQAKPSFATYPLDGLDNIAPDGVVIPFEDGHTRQLPRLVMGPFRYRTHAETYLKMARPPGLGDGGQRHDDLLQFAVGPAVAVHHCHPRRRSRAGCRGGTSNRLKAGLRRLRRKITNLALQVTKPA